MDEAPPVSPGSSATAPVSAGQAAIAEAHVLVVDDVAENRDLLVRRLARMGIGNTREAENGRQALEELQSGRFDLVLLDIMMPVMNGYEVLEKLNAEGRIHDLPVIVISALSEVDDIAKCIEAGAEDFLLKPFNRTLLRARVLSCLEKKFMRDQTRLELQRKQAELDEARTLQLALAPEPATLETPIGKISIDLVLEPAKEVGGDLVDHFPVGEDLYVLVLGDVSDKGAGAALVMARTCSLFRGLSARPDAEELFASPEKAMSEVNAVLAAGNATCMFVTLLLASLDLKNGRLRYVRAGHVPPLLRHADGTLESLGALSGLPLGVMENAAYSSSETNLVPGDSMLVVTDGVTEAVSSAGPMFDDEGVESWFAEPGHEPPRVTDLVAAVRAHENGALPSDDVAVILLHLHAGEEAVNDSFLEVIVNETITPGPANIGSMAERTMEVLEEKGVDLSAAHHVSLVLDELLTNIATHGGAADLPCRVLVSLAPDRIHIMIGDQGKAFDPRSSPEPDMESGVEDRPIGGLGAHLVLSVAQEFDYQSENGCNTTSLWIARAG